MAGMFSDGGDFSWNSSTIFDKIGNQEKRDEYLTDLSGTGNNERELEKEAYRFKIFIEGAVEGRVLGPVNAPIFRLKKRFRARLLIRGRKSLKVQNSLAKIIEKFKFPAGMKLTVDVDPINFN